MFIKYQKKNKRALRAKQLHTSQLKYNPFQLQDTAFLENLNNQLKLRKALGENIQLRKDIAESNARKNYQNELDRLKSEISNPMFGHTPTNEHLKARIEQLKKLTFT